MSRNFGYNVLGLGGSGGDGGANSSTRQCIQLTISGTTQNYNIYSNRGGTYVAGKSDVTLTVQAIVGSAGTGQYAIDTGNQWTSGDTVKIINNSQIVGAGGAAGAGGQGFPPSSFPGSNGSAAGHAINLGFATTIQNNGGNIRGGGGGGGGGGASTAGTTNTTGAGGPGGSSTSNSITGASVARAGGGGGGAYQNRGAGTGGGGGATDGTNMAASTQGVAANTGSGSGGSGADVPNGNVGAGGSGVVVIRVPAANDPGSLSIAPGTNSISTDSPTGDKICTFTVDGTLSF